MLSHDLYWENKKYKLKIPFHVIGGHRGKRRKNCLSLSQIEYGSSGFISGRVRLSLYKVVEATYIIIDHKAIKPSNVKKMNTNSIKLLKAIKAI